MKAKLLIFTLIFCMCTELESKPASTDSISVESSELRLLFEQIVETLEDDFEPELVFENIQEVFENKIDLNNCEKEDLELLFFLSESQIEEILYFRYQNKGYNSLFELQLVKGLDMTDIRNLLPFVKLGKFKMVEKYWWRSLNYARQELLVQFDRTINSKSGYMAGEGGAVAKYAGNQWHNYFKYSLKAENKVFANFSVEKDAGEYFGFKPGKNFDFYSASVLIKPGNYIKELVIGDYLLGFGQGLALNQIFGRGKISSLAQTFNRLQGIRKYSSLNESLFFRGIATTLKKGQTLMTLFFSSRLLDADTTDKEIGSIYLTGYHRTENEISKRNAFRQSVIGYDINKRFKSFQIGCLSYFVDNQYPFVKGDKTYQIFNFEGKNQWIGSLYYRSIWHNYFFYGELAVSDWRHLSYLQGLTFKPTGSFEMNLIYRNYSREYFSFFANAFREGSRVNNEKGIYLGIKYQGVKNWIFNAYADSYFFPWLRYNSDGPSTGSDFYLNGLYTGRGDSKFSFRIKSENYKENTRTAFRIEHSWERYFLRYKTGIEINKIIFTISETKGWALYQDLGFKLWRDKLNVDTRYSVFNTDSYDNRIYLYEKEIYRNFSVPSFSGIGNRFFILLSYEISSRQKCWIKYSITSYTDGREEIGSGNELIQGNSKSDIKIEYQLKL